MPSHRQTNLLPKPNSCLLRFTFFFFPFPLSEPHSSPLVFQALQHCAKRLIAIAIGPSSVPPRLFHHQNPLPTLRRKSQGEGGAAQPQTWTLEVLLQASFQSSESLGRFSSLFGMLACHVLPCRNRIAITGQKSKQAVANKETIPSMLNRFTGLLVPQRNKRVPC